MDVDVEEVENDRNFISKILGEMKTQFNKERKMQSSPTTHEMVNRQAVNNMKEEPSVPLKDDEAKEVLVAPVKEESEDSDKPRIVLTFRKPEKVETAKRSLRAKLQIIDSIPKRSPRRRSRDYNESVLQSAIARKEKSYNEASKPQRLTKQLKATPKILENLAHAALKLDKTKCKDKKESDGEVYNSDESETEEKNGKKLRRNLKSLKKLKNCESKDSDSDQSAHDFEEKNNFDRSKGLRGFPNSIEEKPFRRSHRLSSNLSSFRKDEIEDNLDPAEPDTAEHDCSFPVDPQESPAEAQLVSARLCLCTHKTQLYVSAADDDIVFCTALDSIGGKVVGCNSVVDGTEVAMLRPSAKVPYIILCEVHLNRMLRHNCCPKCGLFCTQGRFAQCEAKHQYHRECQVFNGNMDCCPHCGLATPEQDVLVTMYSSKKPVFLPTQRPHYPPAKMSFTRPKLKNAELQNRTISPLLPSNSLQPIALQNSNGEHFDVDALFACVKAPDLEKLAVVLGSHSVSLSMPLDECEGGTVLHYAAQNGQLPMVHMLVMAGAELDALDKEQNSPLVCATMAFKNNVVKYLIKAGASITLKGTDGMTALHVASKSGNLGACEMLLEAALGIRNYVNSVDDGGWTPLVWACEHAHFEVVKFLLYKGADPSSRDVEQNVGLHWAAFSGNADITEMLLNYKSEVNAVNAHGDTPLHIGARQNMYNCILILLARGANVNLINKQDETPLDCAKPMGDCHAAISLNVHLQVFASETKSTKTILTNDISKGREKNPIQCINNADGDLKPTDFFYISQNCLTLDDVNIDRKTTTMHHCICEEKCVSFNCICCNNSLRCWYDEEGRLLSDFNYADPPMIFECNQLCACNSITCNNRIVQHGITQRFQLFKTNTKGWAIRTLRPIPKGSFVCEYIGELISDLEADKRLDDSYLFDLDNRVKAAKGTEAFCIDAKYYGNLARFINHSCEPNLVPIRVFIEHHDLRFPRIALFANKNIPTDEELSFDYGEKFWIIKYKSFTCDCGSATCKYSQETIASTVENYNKRLEEEGT